MQRITKAVLESRVQSLNERLGMPTKPYALNEETGRYDHQPGCYYVDASYGAFRLERMCDSGGSRDVSLRGPRREVYNFIGAMFSGMQALEAATV